MQELKTEFDKLDLNKNDRPQQKRFLRSQQDLKERMAETTMPVSVMIEDPNMDSECAIVLSRRDLSWFDFSARRSRSI